MVSRAILNGWPLVPPSRRKSAPVNLAAPSISGTFAVGQTLTLSDGTWDGFPTIAFSRQWLRDGVPIAGATGSTYLLVDADANRIISATVTASSSIGSASKDAVGALAQGGGAAKTAGIAGNRFMLPTGSQAYTAPYTSRRVHFAPAVAKVTNLKCVEIDWYIQVNGSVAGSARSLRKYIEYPAGVFHPVLWSGIAQLDLPGTITKAVSDIVISSVTGLPLEIAPAAAYYERTVNLTNIANMPNMILPAASNVLGVSDGNTASDAGNTGTINPTTGTRTFGSVVVFGDIMAADARSVVAPGDSLLWSQGDVTGVGANQSSGWWERMMSAAGIPTLKLAMPGITTGGFIAALSAIADLLSVVPFSEADNELGLNDLTTGASVATILANYQTIYGLFSGKPITQNTITTRTDTSNAYADAAGQTVKTDGNMAGLNTLNDAIRAGLAHVTRVRDVADADMTARNSGIHAGPFPPVLDGTHFTSPKAADLASKLAA